MLCEVLYSNVVVPGPTTYVHGCSMVWVGLTVLLTSHGNEHFRDFG